MGSYKMISYLQNLLLLSVTCLLTKKCRKVKRAFLLYMNVDWFKFQAGTNFLYPCNKNSPSLFENYPSKLEFNLRAFRDLQKVTKKETYYYIYCFRKISLMVCRQATRTDET